MYERTDKTIRPVPIHSRPTAPPNPYPYHQPVAFYQPPPKSRMAYVLLGLFLGGFGIHNFYAGYVGRGIAQLLITILLFWTVVTVIVVWIWVLAEVCAQTRDVHGVRFV